MSRVDSEIGTSIWVRMRVKSWAIRGRELEWYNPVATLGLDIERKQEQTGTAVLSVLGRRFITYVFRFGSSLETYQTKSRERVGIESYLYPLLCRRAKDTTDCVGKCLSMISCASSKLILIAMASVVTQHTLLCRIVYPSLKQRKECRL